MTTALKLVTDLERIGDEAVNLAERAKEGHGVAKDHVGVLLKRMSEQAQQMVRDAAVSNDIPARTKVIDFSSSARAQLRCAPRDREGAISAIARQVATTASTVMVAASPVSS